MRLMRCLRFNDIRWKRKCQYLPGGSHAQSAVDAYADKCALWNPEGDPAACEGVANRRDRCLRANIQGASMRSEDEDSGKRCSTTRETLEEDERSELTATWATVRDDSMWPGIDADRRDRVGAFLSAHVRAGPRESQEGRIQARQKWSVKTGQFFPCF